MLLNLILWSLFLAYAADTYLYARRIEAVIATEDHDAAKTNPVGKFILMAASVVLCFVGFCGVYSALIAPNFVPITALVTLFVFVLIIENTLRKADKAAVSTVSLSQSLRRAFLKL